jgi:PPM family protein phosphatase
MTLSWTAHTDKGRFRDNNEDSFLAVTFDSTEVRLLGKLGEGDLTTSDYVFAVSDGMGGAKSGEFASRIAVEKITRLLPQSFKAAAMGLDSGRGDILAELFTRVHGQMTYLARCYEECRGMGATLSLCWFSPEHMFFCHIGDSRIYLVPHDGPMKQLTDDHTFVGYQFREGLLTEMQARTAPGRNRLQKALGGGQQYIEPQVGVVRFEPRDRFLICSDGVVDGLWNRGIEEAVRAGLDGQQIVKLALDEGSRDNVTAMVISVR